MDIRIIKNTNGINGQVLGNGKVLEREYVKSEYENIPLVKAYVYNLNNNSRTEILPKLKKYELGEIINVSTSSRFVYFFNCLQLLNGKTEINLISYDTEQDECETIYTYIDELNQYNEYKRVRAFVVNDIYIIFQNELLRTNFADTYEGYLDYELFLYSIKDNKKVDIIDENLSANGISTMIPVSEGQCILKTGFSLLKDARYKLLERSEVSVEGISIINPSQLISDMMLQKKNIVLDTMEQTYYTVTIPAVNVQEDYLIYSKVNVESHDEEVVFYNLITKKATKCINRNVFEEKDLTKYYIINSVPFIRLDNEDKTEFYNLVKNRVDFAFEENVVEVVNDLIITAVVKKSFFTGKNDYVKVYKYPQNNLLLREKGKYKGCISAKKDYIYLMTN